MAKNKKIKWGEKAFESNPSNLMTNNVVSLILCLTRKILLLWLN